MKQILGLAVAAAMLSPALAQRDFSAVEITTTEVVPGVYMLQGAGGNIGLSVGEDGAFVIDDQFAPLNEKIVKAIEAVTDKPVEFVLNTHYHGDHTGGNEAFGKAGAHIVAHDNVRKRLSENEEVGAGALPILTFSATATFYLNGHELFVFHPANAHTDGDAIVYFRDIDVMHTGDVLFVGNYPYIDTDGGGGIDGYISAQDHVLAMIGDETKVIPGHGPLSTKQEIEASNAMLKEVRNRIQALINDGLDEDAVVAADPLADLNPIWGQGFIDGERMTRSVYKSLAK